MPPRTQNRKSSPVRRREIAAAALRLIGEEGAPALTAARIAREVGVTAGALFRHFESVEAILVAAVELAVEDVEASFPDEDLPPLERLRALLLARIDLIRRRPGLAWLLLSEQVFLSVPGPALASLRALVSRSQKFVRRALSEGVAQGELRDDLGIDVMQALFTGVVHSMANRRGVHARPRGKPTPRSPKPERVLDTLVELLGSQDD